GQSPSGAQTEERETEKTEELLSKGLVAGGLRIIEEARDSEAAVLQGMDVGAEVLSNLGRLYETQKETWVQALQAIERPKPVSAYESCGFALEHATIQTELEGHTGERYQNLHTKDFQGLVGAKRRRKGHIGETSKRVLENVFRVKQFPNSRERERIALRCGLSTQQVRVWFTNKRARSKNKT
ncbi:hypothetical protein OGAPHI_003543, partial [Ogataea philodendri]